MENSEQGKQPTPATKTPQGESSPNVLVVPTDPLHNLSDQDSTTLRKALREEFQKDK